LLSCASQLLLNSTCPSPRGGEKNWGGGGKFTEKSCKCTSAPLRQSTIFTGNCGVVDVGSG